MGTVLLGLAVGLAVGAVVGLVGAGGAIIAVPALVYLVGLDPADAVPTSLVVVGASAVAGVLPRIKTAVDWPLVLLIGAAGFPASWAGAAVGRMLDEDLLMLFFSGIMVLAGIRMLAGTRDRPDPFPAAGRARWLAVAPRALAIGVLVGFLTGLLGVGGGFLIIPALTLLLGVPIRTAVGTSLAIIAINSASGFAAHLDGLSIDWSLTLGFAAVAVASSLAAARIAHRLNDRLVTRTFAVVIFLVAAWVAAGTLAGLA